MHAERHLERVDACGDLGIAGRLEARLVQAAQRVQRIALQLRIDSARIRQVEHRIAGAPELHTLIDGGQEAAAPAGIAAAGALLAGAGHDESRQILRLAAQAVGDPGAHARPAELLRPRIHEELSGRVVECVGHHGLDYRHLVYDLGKMRNQLG